MKNQLFSAVATITFAFLTILIPPPSYGDIVKQYYYTNAAFGVNLTYDEMNPFAHPNYVWADFDSETTVKAMGDTNSSVFTNEKGTDGSFKTIGEGTSIFLNNQLFGGVKMSDIASLSWNYIKGDNNIGETGSIGAIIDWAPDQWEGGFNYGFENGYRLTSPFESDYSVSSPDDEGFVTHKLELESISIPRLDGIKTDESDDWNVVFSTVEGMYVDWISVTLKNGEEYRFNFDFQSSSPETATPEPATMFIVGLGLVGLGLRRRFTKK